MSEKTSSSARPPKHQHDKATGAVVSKPKKLMDQVSEALRTKHYGILSETDVRKQIAALGNEAANSDDVQELRSLVNRLLVKLERSGAT